MPLLALAIPFAQSSSASYESTPHTDRHEIAIDMEKIKNQPLDSPSASLVAKLPEAHFRRTVFESHSGEQVLR